MQIRTNPLLCGRLLVVLVLSLSPFLPGCATDRAVISQAAQFHNSLEPAVIEDPQLSSYIQRVGDRIIAAAREVDQGGESNAWMFSKDMRFHFVNSKTINAFTTGGNHMYIYSQLFREAKSEDELAAVMAHEFAHVYGRHVQSGMNRQYAILGAAAAAGAAGYAAGGDDKGGEYAGLAAGAAMLAGQFVGMSYTRGDEAEADKLGFDFYVRAGWDPKRFGDFFQRMIEMGYDKGPEFLSDHPSLSRRLKTVQEYAAQLPASARQWQRSPVAGPQELQRLQERAATVAANMPSDESLRQTQQLLAAWNRSCLTPAIHEDQKEAEKAVLSRAKGPEVVGRRQ